MSLLDLQRSLRDALLTKTSAAPATVLSGPLAAAARVAIYRNNVVCNLTGALRLTFPAVERLVGTEFFDAAAGCFVLKTPPASADLYEYGGAFPAFLAAFEPAQGLAYLADVARLEWAVNFALHATVAPILAADGLIGVPEQNQPGLRFVAHPSLSLLTLAHSAKAIWEAVMTEDEQARALRLADVDFAAGIDNLAVLQGIDGLAVVNLAPAAHELAVALIGGQCIADALDLVPPEDAAPLLGGLIAHGFFSGYVAGDPS